ncbi:hypothetical protein PSH87_14355 [Pseudomonas sp. FP453]|uniref:hypothetical protein n=1 Tax=Pseudomonas sp. FP453 TaxID=2954094 RepID=UPI0027331C14|nr:hypothetical protein [Pseudomonas sp. FP453]WLH87874.1 hypothetical protein PSH87_14355 [Pseudomonas sp. FP453]
MLVKILAFLVLIVSSVWLYVEPGYEPGLAVLTSLSALIGIWISKRNSANKPSQSQSVGAGGVAVQAGGDIKVGDITTGACKDA